MARSHKIYLVFDDPQSPPFKAFTVKHEMVTWLKKQERSFFWGFLADGAHGLGFSGFLETGDLDD